ncbi:hypothetical protein LTR84_006669 [Exophiala bonariae]|uniref:Fungal N-terminal domain-containing protein n=1 Tax=Exophiala bonariae TaxID=1690606 RepID=A0AAV9N459_9EURO|nr:hypothetical protein LTR84_006669 [Exophiala bonariae]
MADPFSTVSAVSSGFTTSLRIFQIIYEIQAVGEQTRDLLETTKLVTETITQVKKLRHQKSCLLNDTEKVYIDNCISASENAVKDVAILAERSRADMVTRQGRTKDISFKSRALYVLKDSPKVPTNINRMSIATQGLNASMGILCSRTGPIKANLYRSHSSAVDRRSSTLKPPPPYELVEFLQRRTKSDPEQLHEFARTGESLAGEVEKTPTTHHHEHVIEDITTQARYKQVVCPSDYHSAPQVHEESLGGPTLSLAGVEEGASNCRSPEILAIPRHGYSGLPARTSETPFETRATAAEILKPIPPPIPPRPKGFQARVIDPFFNTSNLQYQGMPDCSPNQMRKAQCRYELGTTAPQRKPPPTPPDTTTLAELSSITIQHSQETNPSARSMQPNCYELDSNAGTGVDFIVQATTKSPPATSYLLDMRSSQSFLSAELSAASSSVLTPSFEVPAEYIDDTYIQSFSSSPAPTPQRQLSHGRRWLEDHAL